MTDNTSVLALGRAPVGRLLAAYALPAIVAMAASSVYNIIDAIFIGHGVGPEAIMGLALTSPLMALTAAFGAMVGVGASTLMSMRLGQKDYASASRILGNEVMMNLAMGTTLGAAMLLALDPMLVFFGASHVTLPYARDFMQVILAGNVVTHLYLGLNAMLRATGRPRQAMACTVGTVGLNVMLAPLFIFLLGWGIRGAATATVTAQGLMLLVQLRMFRKGGGIVRLERKAMRPETRIVRDALVIGLPQFLINACMCLVTIIVARSMTHYGGDVAVGAYGIVNRVVMFVVLIVIGINQGMQPIAGYNYGAGRHDRLVRLLFITIGAATAVTTAGFLLGTFAAGPLVSLFASDAPELTALAAWGFRTAVAAFPLVGLQMVATTFFQSIGHASTSIFLSLSRQLLLLVPLLLILPRIVAPPLAGVWYAMPASDALSALLAIALLAVQVRRLRRGRK